MSSQKHIFIISGKSAINMSGGLGAYAYNLAKIFKVLGYKVYVLGFNDVENSIEKDNIVFKDIKTPFNSLKGLGVGLTTPYFVKALRKIIDREKPDHILVYGMATWNYVGIKLKKQLPKLNIKTLVSCFTTHKHELMGHIRGAPISDYGILPFLKYVLAYVLDLLFIKHYDKKAILGADRIIMHYQSSKQIIEADYGQIPADKYFSIPYCVELYERDSGIREADHSFKNKADRQNVVAICRQDPRKGLNTFIKAIGILKKQALDFDCYVVGAGPFLNDNINLARKLGLEEAISFLGFVDDIKPFLHGADVYVLPALEEGAGAISLLEAMKVGVPIVTTICDGIPEDFTHERNALLVEMNDVKNLAQQIKRILQDEKLRETLSVNAINDYKDKFTFEGMLKGIENVIKDL